MFDRPDVLSDSGWLRSKRLFHRKLQGHARVDNRRTSRSSCARGALRHQTNMQVAFRQRPLAAASNSCGSLSAPGYASQRTYGLPLEAKHHRKVSRRPIKRSERRQIETARLEVVPSEAGLQAKQRWMVTTSQHLSTHGEVKRSRLLAVKLADQPLQGTFLGFVARDPPQNFARYRFNVPQSPGLPTRTSRRQTACQ